MVGVYALLHQPSGKSYIGSSINIEDRVRRHFYNLHGNRHHSPKLQRQWNESGNEFTVLILEQCAEKDLTSHEQLWIDSMDTFNESNNAKNPMRDPVIAEKSSKACRGKKKSPRTDEHCRNISAANRGRKLTDAQVQAIRERVISPETRLKQAKAIRGRKLSKKHRQALIKANTGKPCSEETRRKIGNAHRGKIITEEQRQRLREVNLGKKHSEASKRKIGETIRKRNQQKKGESS